MTEERTSPPPFYCPACGKKHRADLTAIQVTPGAVAKVTCARCEAEMSLRIGDDGLPKCEIPEPTATNAEPAAPPAPIGLQTGGAMPRSPILVSVLAAAVVAAAVGFLAAKAGAGADTAAPREGAPAADGDALRGTVDDLRAELDAMRTRVQELEAAAAHARSDVGARVQVMDERLATLEAASAQQAGSLSTMKATVDAASGATKDLNGRIEANYVNLRKLTKRVDQLEK